MTSPTVLLQRTGTYIYWAENVSTAGSNGDSTGNRLRDALALIKDLHDFLFALKDATPPPPAGDAGLLREARNRIWNFHRERHFGEFNPSDCSTCLFLAQLNAALSATRPDAFGAAAVTTKTVTHELSGDASVADRKDAARYRFLRNDPPTSLAVRLRRSEKDGGGLVYYDGPDLDHIVDAAIDSAMAGEPDKGAAS